MFYNDENYKEWLLYNQYTIPRRYEYIAKRFGNDLTYNQITKLYALSVDIVLITNNIKILSDLPFGQGYFLAKKYWIELMAEANKKNKYNNKNINK